VIPDAEVERLKREQEQKRLRIILIECYAKARRISPASALRWVERQEKQGKSAQEMAKEMAEKISQERLRNAGHSHLVDTDKDYPEDFTCRENSRDSDGKV
jgi:hypothetical protein